MESAAALLSLQTRDLVQKRLMPIFGCKGGVHACLYALLRSSYVLQQTEFRSHTTGCGAMSNDFTTLRRGKQYCRNGAVENGFPSAALAPPAK
jgi:hypothetical protein